MTADEVVRVVLGWAREQGAFVFVGNGYLSRLVSAVEAPFAYCLFGGMSLALPMGVGFAQARPGSKVVVLEGDGNFWMGFGGQPVARCAVVHVVVANGVFASTGGQRLGSDVSDPTAVAVLSGAYHRSARAADPAELRSGLADAGAGDGATLVWAVVDRPVSAPPRTAATPQSVTRSFRSEVPPVRDRQVVWSSLLMPLERWEAVADEGRFAAGDIVLGELARLGTLTTLEQRHGDAHELRPGDLVACVLGDRFSLEGPAGRVPDALVPGARLVLLASSALVGVGIEDPWALRTDWTRVSYQGRLRVGGEPQRLDRRLPPPPKDVAHIPIVAVAGASTGAGKSTAASMVIEELSRRGVVVGACKATGTGRLRDSAIYLGAGADFVADLSDAGLASSYGVTGEAVTTAARSMVHAAADAGCELVVVEMGGDFLSAGARDLMADPWMMASTQMLVCVCPDLPSVVGVLALAGEAWKARLRFAPTKAHNVLLGDRMWRHCGVQIESIPLLVDAILAEGRVG